MSEPKPDARSQREEGIHALNQSFRRYEQVEKQQSYHLAEDASSEQFDDELEIRSCDMALARSDDDADRRTFATQLGEALHEIGFAILTGHGIDPGLYRRCEERTRELFEQCPLEQKLAYRAARFGSVSQGYFPIKETSDIHPDLVEGWVFCRRAFDLGESADFRADAFWPLPDLEPTFRELVQANEALILPLTQAMLRYLGCDPHLLDERLEGTNFGLRLNYYPPVSDDEDASGAGRLLGHEDVDLFTLLPAPRVEGLQVLNRRNGKWVRLQAPPDSIILNTGDYMQRLSNDLLPSTTHRVSKPRDPAQRQRLRISLPMAVYLWEDEMLEVLPGIPDPRYPPIRAITFHTRATSKFYGDGYAVEAPEKAGSTT